MKYDVVFYCPDRHIAYDIRTLEQKGVGGGITARVRVAHALARKGHEVVIYANCPEEGKFNGVTYRHFSKYGHQGADIFIAGTSGGDLDLGSIRVPQIRAGKKVLMIHGVDIPANVKTDDYDALYILSNFVRTIAIDKWQVNPKKVFVTYRGIEELNFNPVSSQTRDPYSLVYLGHPSKGLDSALAIFHILHSSDPRFSLHVYGGNQLWGGVDEAIPTEEELYIHGLVGQIQLAGELQKYGFSLNLQAREEPFGMAVIESMRAGCIVLASPVGAYPELIYTGYNGFLVPGLHTDPQTREKASRLVLELLTNPGYMNYVRTNSIKFPLTWDTVAEAWENHWDWLNTPAEKQQALYESTLSRYIFRNCSLLMLADGLHCVECGHYDRWAANNNFHDHLYTVMI